MHYIKIMWFIYKRIYFKQALLALLINALYIHIALAQSNPPLYGYRTQENPFYWKNKIPVPGYWQQDVHYEIAASLDESKGILDGTEKLTYWNNSPDSLSFVFFHLYQNAFQPGSYLDNLTKNNGGKPVYGKYESNGLGTSIIKISVNNMELHIEQDNTILKVYLAKPLKSGDSLKFDILFKSYFDTGSTRRRMKTFNVGTFKHYDGVLWYPRMCVYDSKFGWETAQHLNREFYGDFGTFDVSLTLANDYILEATGTLINRKEVLPDSLRKKLDIKNFAKKPFNSPSSILIVNDGTKKTWKYHAVNVHDFAFTADPTYRIGEAYWNGIQCISMVQEPHAAGWQNAASYASKIIQTYSQDFGMYAYPKMVVADALDGMEYPMLTLDAGKDPTYRSLLCHEIGHNWFYGMVGSNETYRAFLDEGFTQFLEAWSLDKLEGNYDTLQKSTSSYINYFKTPVSNKDKNVYYGYLIDALSGDDGFLNTHSDNFNGALGQGGGYRQVYSKTATMLYNLQYVLGDSLFLSAMQHYFNEWKMCHPYPEDFRASIIHSTKVDLNWFFDQWLETDKRIDYGIQSIKKGPNSEAYQVTFVRKERMQMPLDFHVKSKNGKIYDYHIPNTWFIKKTNATILPKWIGWDKLNPTYTANLFIPEGIEEISIDTTLRLADVNLLNNSTKLPLSLTWDAHVPNFPDRTKYELKARPETWYNGYDGIKVGMHINGNYMNYLHVFDLTLWLNTGLGQQKYIHSNLINNFDILSYRLNYKTPLTKIDKNTSFNLNTKYLDGLVAEVFGLDKVISNTHVYINLKSMYRPNIASREYLFYQNEWELKKFNNTLNIGMNHTYNFTGGKGRVDLNLRSNTLGSDYNYNAITLKIVTNQAAGKFDLNTRYYAQYGRGTLIPNESSLYMAGANPEELMENKYTRSRGFVDNSWLGYGNTTNHFQQGGGLNIRGYAGYLAPFELKDGTLKMTYKGLSGASVSTELGFDRFFNLKPKATRTWLKINTYAFADAGIISTNNPGTRIAFSDIRADAGLGAAFTIKKWGVLQQIKPLTIRFDMPLLLNAIPATDAGYFKFRWLIGINRTF
jgi:hypothetical protein